MAANTRTRRTLHVLVSVRCDADTRQSDLQHLINTILDAADTHPDVVRAAEKISADPSDIKLAKYEQLVSYANFITNRERRRRS